MTRAEALEVFFEQKRSALAAALARRADLFGGEENLELFVLFEGWKAATLKAINGEVVDGDLWTAAVRFFQRSPLDVLGAGNFTHVTTRPAMFQRAFWLDDASITRLERIIHDFQ